MDAGMSLFSVIEKFSFIENLSINLTRDPAVKEQRRRARCIRRGHPNATYRSSHDLPMLYDDYPKIGGRVALVSGYCPDCAHSLIALAVECDNKDNQMRPTDVEVTNSFQMWKSGLCDGQPGATEKRAIIDTVREASIASGKADRERLEIAMAEARTRRTRKKQ